MTAAASPAPDGPLFTSAAKAAAAFISDGGTVPARNARAWSVQRLEDMSGGLAGWLAAPLARRLAAPVDVRGVAVWLALATAAPVDAAYICAARAEWGCRLAGLEPRLAAAFTATATRLGYSARQAGRQWAALARLAAAAGQPPGQLDRQHFDAARDAMTAAARARHGRLPNTFTTPLHGLQATLAAMGGILDEPEGRRVTGRGIPARWQTLAGTAPVLAGTMRRYLAQLAISMRPGSVALAGTTLRHLAACLTAHHQDVTTAAQTGRTHIEGFKAWLNARPGYRGHRSPAATTTGMRPGHLRCFFDRIIEWGYDDAPARNPVFSGDMPIRDRPLPRFPDDADAARLLAAARQLPGLFDRVAVEVLARTGRFSCGQFQHAGRRVGFSRSAAGQLLVVARQVLCTCGAGCVSGAGWRG